ncbi:MAG: type IV pilus modification PilV family protein [Planctomycetota bacterium]|jgi:Tfp pilus assembly protein PilV
MSIAFDNRKGLTLAEAMLAMVILGITTAGVLLPFAGGAKVRREGVHRTLGAKLGADLLEEIINTPFDEIISGYNGYTEAQGQVKDANGVVFTDSNYATFSRDVICEEVYVPQESGGGEAKFIRVSVRVFYNGEETTNISRLINE